MRVVVATVVLSLAFLATGCRSLVEYRPIARGRQEEASQTSRKLVVFMDGTANAPGRSRTNVLKLYNIVNYNAQLHDFSRVIPYYVSGVGTDARPGSGCLGGRGISKRIRKAYGFLCKNYCPGDKIYIFGFSRGAYSARALSAMVHHCGLVQNTPSKMAEQERKKKGVTKEPDDKHIKHIYKKLFRKQRDPIELAGKVSEYVAGKPDLRLDPGRQADPSDGLQAEVLGVWDTVAKLGSRMKEKPKSYHADKLWARRGYHALALDERRGDYAPVHFDPLKSEGITLKQVWFPGAHSDVGGGYVNGRNRIGDVTLFWMIQQLRDDGLVGHEFLDHVDRRRPPEVFWSGEINDELRDGKFRLVWRSLEKLCGKGDRDPSEARDSKLHSCVRYRSDAGLDDRPNGFCQDIATETCTEKQGEDAQ